MLKSLGWIAAGLAAGILAMALVQRTPDEPDEPENQQARSTRAGDSAGGRPELESLAERMSMLEARVAALTDELTQLRSGPSPSRSESSVPTETTGVLATAELMRALAERSGAQSVPDDAAAQQGRDRTVGRLIEGGFAPARAEWVQRRSEELVLEFMQARYNAERNGEALPSDYFVEQSLREELGDAEYEQYLTALGRPASVSVVNVLPSSPAELAGLQIGDRIVSYSGTRLFDMRELNALILEGRPGESVVIEVERNGLRIPLVVPRGPLGIAMSSGRTLTIRPAQP